MSHLESQVVLITGCSTGLGRALAKEFHRRGHRTFASARRPESIEDLSEQGLDTVALDVTDTESIERAVATAVERAGRIDMIVNNAGFNLFGPIVEVPLDGFRQLFDTNVTGPIAVAQAVFPYMAKARYGRIVNIGSVVGIFGTPFAGPYCATKSALHMLSEVLRVEVAPFGIDVVVVQPGGVRSNIAKTGSQGLERYAEERSYYRAVARQIEMRANASQDNPMEASDFAKKVVEAVTRKKAPRVVRAGTRAAALPRLRRLPDFVIERILGRWFGLGRLRQ